MKIGIDCRQIYDIEKNIGAGIPRYIFHLVKNILSQDKQSDFVLFFDEKISQQTIDSLKVERNFKIIKVKNQVPFFSAHFFFTLQVWREFLDWTIFPSGSMPFFYLGKSLLIIHDLIIYTQPHWFPNKQWFSKLLVVPASVTKASKIVTISEATKKTLLYLFKFRQDKDIRVIYSGITPTRDYGQLAVEEVMKEHRITKPFLLFVGTIEPRKNLNCLINAFYQYKKETKTEIELIIAGAKGWKYKNFFNRLNEKNQLLGTEAIRYIGKVSDKERNILMQKAECFVFPSYFEGFGLPVLEAMINSCPVITSNTGATGEIITDQAIKIDPKDSIELYLAIKKILQDKKLREDLIEKGSQYAKTFTWDKTADQILEFIKIP
ncbi:hypothetical protein A2223_01860 [Candidatus Falkowbacteria bacterium RIFOXYA2_FULL_35_8]|uniref:Glycosyl transferase family 1 domain-containing protein n=1 Tax=Candidatus Falkowbacteria bacterium RIFOXYC2_FULL_36_12 TaxID=1798002 RepID=A0A1F5SZ07_9BACT|nr:MAG: hypothetical protein A2478_05470 [Candidatus Falkowbacteria bacterium RIFOXYC2_FULL_36_12]OGF34004.1 MAG: hypothetical protein A2223_01860 [Candidatus Falkowbacteria bacterium RIFOXYA2_FULL_35_8]